MNQALERIHQSVTSMHKNHKNHCDSCNNYKETEVKGMIKVGVCVITENPTFSTGWCKDHSIGRNKGWFFWTIKECPVCGRLKKSKEKRKEKKR